MQIDVRRRIPGQAHLNISRAHGLNVEAPQDGVTNAAQEVDELDDDVDPSDRRKFLTLKGRGRRHKIRIETDLGDQELPSRRTGASK